MNTNIQINPSAIYLNSDESDAIKEIIKNDNITDLSNKKRKREYIEINFINISKRSRYE